MFKLDQRFNYDFTIPEMLSAAGYYYADTEAAEIASAEKYYSRDWTTGDYQLDAEEIQDHLNRLNLDWIVTGAQDSGNIYTSRVQIASDSAIDF